MSGLLAAEDRQDVIEASVVEAVGWSKRADTDLGTGICEEIAEGLEGNHGGVEADRERHPPRIEAWEV